jgi:hypothetical protein
MRSTDPAYALGRLPTPGPSETVLSGLSRAHLDRVARWWRRENEAQYQLCGYPERIACEYARLDAAGQ